jgi:hypothetical protein
VGSGWQPGRQGRPQATRLGVDLWRAFETPGQCPRAARASSGSVGVLYGWPFMPAGPLGGASAPRRRRRRRAGTALAACHTGRGHCPRPGEGQWRARPQHQADSGRPSVPMFPLLVVAVCQGGDGSERGGGDAHDARAHACEVSVCARARTCARACACGRVVHVDVSKYRATASVQNGVWLSETRTGQHALGAVTEALLLCSASPHSVFTPHAATAFKPVTWSLSMSAIRCAPSISGAVRLHPSKSQGLTSSRQLPKRPMHAFHGLCDCSRG